MNQHLQDQVDRVREKQQQDASRIRNRRDLTPQAKRQRLKDIDEAARTAMSELQAGAAGDAEAGRRGVHRTAFGLDDLPGGAAANAFAHRDAQQRVAGITNSRDAAAVYAEAASYGDEVLARAVAARALAMQSSPLSRLDQGWLGVLNDFVTDRPDKVDDVQALLDGQRRLAAGDLFAFAVPPSNDAA